jgi:hypothetical protein
MKDEWKKSELQKRNGKSLKINLHFFMFEYAIIILQDINLKEFSINQEAGGEDGTALCRKSFASARRSQSCTRKTKVLHAKRNIFK